MIKEKLEKEAEEWIAKNSKEFITNPTYSPFDYAKAIYLAGAEPREKRIEELEKENAELEKENAELKKESDFFHREKGEYKSAFLKEVLEKNKINKNLTKAKEIIKYTLNKIIETVQNDKIDEYGARLVLINDFAYKCLEEIKND